MSVGTNIPVERVEELAARVQREAGSLEASLNSLRSACQREENFTGSAAQRYDEFLTQWDQNQQALLQSIRGAGDILSRLASVVRENNDAAASALTI
ncbi:WXG100 family type VII secretion target [Mycolicibacterium neoaurum]|uniref:WXG100 family type VII secretion target n=1 Tax=Mycolicibacterium neoaurum TaxID=1795 RepID=UPI003D6D54EE